MTDLTKLIRTADRFAPRPAPRSFADLARERQRRRIIDEIERVETEAAI